MGYYFAKFISYLLHPLILPSVIMATVLYTETLPRTYMLEDSFGSEYYSDDFRWHALELFAILTLILPALSIGMMRMSGYVTDLEVSHARERNYPLLVIIICYASIVAVLSFGQINAFSSFMIPALVGAVIAMTIALVSLRWIKISGHMMAIGISTAIGYCYFQTQLDFPPYIMLPFFAGAGLLAMARYMLGLHTLVELVVGYAVGFLLEYIAISYNWNPTQLFA